MHQYEQFASIKTKVAWKKSPVKKIGGGCLRAKDIYALRDNIDFGCQMIQIQTLKMVSLVCEGSRGLYLFNGGLRP